METCEMGDEVRFTDKDLLLFLQFVMYSHVPKSEQEMQIARRNKDKGVCGRSNRRKRARTQVVLPRKSENQKIMLLTIALEGEDSKRKKKTKVAAKVDFQALGLQNKSKRLLLTSLFSCVTCRVIRPQIRRKELEKMLFRRK
jgi:hypothetical protein